MFKTITTFLVDYFRAFFLAGIVWWLVFPDFFTPTYYWLTPLIIWLMYLWSLDIDWSALWSLKKYRKQVIQWYVVMMLLLPLVLYFLLWPIIWNEVATGVFLLSIAPAWIAAVAFTRLMGWNSLLALCLAIISTLTFPFLLPLMTQYFLSQSVAIDSMAMFTDLLLYCILPIAAWWATQQYLPIVKRHVSDHIDRVSIIMITLMITWPVAYNASVFLDLKLSYVLLTVVWLFGLSALLHLAWWFTFTGAGKENKIAWSLSKWFMNISVVTVVAAKFFSPTVLLIVMLYEFPRDLMLIPFKWVMKRVKG